MTNQRKIKSVVRLFPLIILGGIFCGQVFAQQPAREADLAERAFFGDVVAMFDLGIKIESDYRTGLKTEDEFLEVIDLFEKSAEGGFATAGFRLGQLYYSGVQHQPLKWILLEKDLRESRPPVLPVDKSMAAYWFSKVGFQHDWAAARRAVMYGDGDGVGRNITVAKSELKRLKSKF